MRELLLYAAQVAAGVVCGILAAGNMWLKKWPLLTVLQLISLVVTYLSPTPWMWKTAFVRLIFQLHAGWLLMPDKTWSVALAAGGWCLVTALYDVQSASDPAWLMLLAAALVWKRSERPYQIRDFWHDWVLAIFAWQVAAIANVDNTDLSALLLQVGAPPL
jgi:hypothetical protein